jgi:3-hydroxyacyl-CoA dehydrogenase / enoyl-CoA hydratase / 3-hydroxybutyryl-CoA epimerase
LTGKTVRPSKARKLGLVDEVVPKPILLAVATQRARELASGKRQVERSHRFHSVGKHGLSGFLQGLTKKDLWSELALEDNPLGRRVLFEQARKQVLRKTKGKYPAPLKALEAVRTGLEHGIEEGLKLEAKAFGELVVSDVSRRLVEVFFATTELKKENGTSDPTVQPRPVKKIGILGGGLMGGGIAYVTVARMSVPVRIKERDDPSVGRALKYVGGLFKERVDRRELNWREANAKLALATAATDLSGFKHVDLVIEAVFEDLALKQKVLQDIEAVTSEQCIFASNTSALPIGKIAAASRHPQTVIGMHYFSPVNKMPLLEVIRQAKTDDWVAATAVDVGRKQGKTVIVVNDGPGFYTSRIIAPYMNEASQLLVEGADIAELDRALVEFGFPVGPITLLDEVGIDVAAKVAKFLQESFGDRLAAPESFQKVIQDGRTGRKGNKGFYTYNGKKKGVDESVYALLPQGKQRKRFDREEMAERCVLQFVNEAIRCLEENILRSPRDGDVGAIFGLGFPPFLGGPFRYVDSVGASKVLGKMERWQEALGKRFEPAPLLKEMAKFNKKFYPG